MMREELKHVLKSLDRFGFSRSSDMYDLHEGVVVIALGLLDALVPYATLWTQRIAGSQFQDRFGIVLGKVSGSVVVR